MQMPRLSASRFLELSLTLCVAFHATAGQSSTVDSTITFASGQMSNVTSAPTSVSMLRNTSAVDPSTSTAMTGSNWSTTQAPSSIAWSAQSTAQPTSSSVGLPMQSSLAGPEGNASQSQSSPPTYNSAADVTIINVNTMTMTVPTTTGTTASPSIVVPNQYLASTSQYLLTTIIVAPNVSSRSRAFWLLMEGRLAQVCQTAFNRNEAMNLGTYVAYKRRKRVTTVSSVTVQMVNVTRLTDYPARLLLIYAVAKDGILINATVTATVLGLLDVQEMALVLQYVVKQAPQEFNYVAPQDLRLWIIAAVLGPVGLIALIWIITCIVLRNRLRRKQVSAKVATRSDLVAEASLADGKGSKAMATPLIGWSTPGASSAQGSAKENLAVAATPLQSDGERSGLATARGQPQPYTTPINAVQTLETSAAQNGGRSGSSRGKRIGVPSHTALDSTEQQQKLATDRQLPSTPLASTVGTLQASKEAPEVPPRRLPSLPQPIATEALYAEVRPPGRVLFEFSDVDADSSPSMQKKQKRRQVDIRHLPSMGSASSQQNIIAASETESETPAGGRSPLRRKSRAQMHKILDAVMYAMFDENNSKKGKQRARSSSSSSTSSSSSSSSSSTSSSSSSSASGSAESRRKAKKASKEKNPSKGKKADGKSKKSKDGVSKPEQETAEKSKDKSKKKKLQSEKNIVEGEAGAAGVTGHDSDNRISDFSGREPSAVEQGLSTALAAEGPQPRTAAEAWGAQPAASLGPALSHATEKRHKPLRLQPLHSSSLTAAAAPEGSPYRAADVVAQLFQPMPVSANRPTGPAASAQDNTELLPPRHTYKGTGPNRVLAGMQEPELAPQRENDGYTSITMTTAMLGLV